MHRKFQHDHGLQKYTIAKAILVSGNVFLFLLGALPCICASIVLYCILSVFFLHLLTVDPLLNPLLLLLEAQSHLIPAGS